MVCVTNESRRGGRLLMAIGTESDQHDEPAEVRPLRASARVISGVLLAIPMIALALVPSYSYETPRLWGMPFFYWYLLLWVIITPIFTGGAYLVITRARGEKP
jgi:hypothetical protein